MPEQSHPPTTSTTGARAEGFKTQTLDSTPVEVPNDCHEALITITVDAWLTSAASQGDATTKLGSDATRFRMTGPATFSLGCRQMKARGLSYWLIAESTAGEISTARTFS